jgi:uridine phosphorylase
MAAFDKGINVEVKQIPIISWDTDGKSFVEPGAELTYQRQHKRLSPINFPDCCIICYQSRLIDIAKKQFKIKPLEYLLRDWLYEFSYNGKRIGIIQSGIGGPITALVLERLIVRNVKYFLSAGTAGSLQFNDVKTGDIILCTKAIRNEGTSYHYMAPSKYSYPDSDMAVNIEQALKKKDIPYQAGATVTTDAPYRWTVDKALQFRSEGVLVSEMEASTVFAVSKFRNVKSAAIFTISDLTTEDFKWEPKYHTEELEKGMKKLFMACIETFDLLKIPKKE